MKCKKIVALLLAMILMIGVLAACGGQANSSAPETDEPSTNGEDTPPEEEEGSEEGAESDGDKEVVIMGLDDHFPPMGFRDEDHQLVGFDIDLAKEVAKRIDVELQLEPINWAAKEMELDTGKVDVLWNGLTITPERLDAMLITPPYLRNAQVILVQTDSEIADRNGLAGKIVAYQNGSSAINAIENPENGLLDLIGEGVGYDDNINALNDLEIGRVDALVIDKIVAEYYMTKKQGVYKMLEDELAAEEFGIAVKKGNTELHDKICDALEEMIADGTAENISKEWFGENRIVFER